MEVTNKGQGKAHGKLKKAEKLQLPKLKEKEPKLNAGYQAWLQQNKGLGNVKRAVETHTIGVGIVGDYSFYTALGQSSTKISEYLAIMIPIVDQGTEKV